ncbi:MAG TPA: hypothetical protein VGR38_12600 [Candidatus Polarisedimenticolia bacterium]|nr:hypothetical protein [Candidatus Polarisedimenticolia bacterium]
MVHPSGSILSFIFPAALALSAILTACGSGGDIQPGVGAAGIRVGDDRAAVEKSLGKPQSSSSSGGQGDQSPETTYLLYPSRGIDVLLEGTKVRSIFLYNEGVEEHKKYPGKGPSGITLGSTRKEVLKALGDPTTRGLGSEADSWFRYDSGLEVAFQNDGTIHHFVVTRPH